MARIRTVKPEFFRHEGLQDLEAENKGSYVMLVFEALWTQCDSQGVFKWKPRMMKLDILPFLEYDLNKTLKILVGKGYVIKYSVDGEEYGYVPTFLEHQRITGKEATEGVKHPLPSGGVSDSEKEAPEKQQGSNREAPKPKSMDFIDQIVKAFSEEYETLNKLPYVIITQGKERAAAQKILSVFKKQFPDKNTEQALTELRVYFKDCVSISDPWLSKNMSLAIVVSKFNEINNIIRNGDKRKGSNSGVSAHELAAITAANFASDNQ
jgi:hypothetical protein